MDVSVVIINWNSKEFLRTCLRSLESVSPSLSFEIIVIDNASHDGCGQMLAAEFPQVFFLQSEANLGFSRANNLAARQATGRALLFLNPDTELIEDSLSLLASHLDKLPAAGAVGCKLLNADRSLQRSCIQAFPSVLNQFLDSDFLRDRFPRSSLWGTAAFLSVGSQPEVVPAVSGACFMVKREVFDRVGGWTEAYFMYGEDLDLSYKIQKAGSHVYYVPKTSVVHYAGKSTEKAKSSFSYIVMRESVYRFLRLHRGWVSASGYRLAMAGTSTLRLLLIVPLLLAGDRLVKHGTGSLQKWLSILRWSLGLETWATMQVPSSAPLAKRPSVHPDSITGCNRP